MGAWEATDPNTADGSDADVTVTRFYSAGGVQLASKTTGGSTLVTLGDVQGSAQVTVDGSGQVARNAYTPYGVKRAGSNVASAHGWLNQIADADTGLTYLNARYYDPVLGRFLSPDPLMNPGDPRTLDPYRYADNNPVVYTDANGLAPSCAGLSGQAMTNCATYAGGTKNYVTGAKDPRKSEDPLGYYSRQAIPKHPGVGKVSIGAFIETPMAGLLGASSAGDNRGFDSRRTWSDSRFAIEVDYSEGALYTHVSSSCYDIGHLACHPATPGGVTVSYEDILSSDHAVGLYALEAASDVALNVDFGKSNPAVTGAPPLNLTVTVAPLFDDTVLVDVNGDVYPSIEAYHHWPNGQTTTLIQSHAFLSAEQWSAAFLLFSWGNRGTVVG